MYGTYMARLSVLPNAAVGVMAEIRGPANPRVARVKKIWLAGDANAAWGINIQSAVTVGGVRVALTPSRLDTQDATVAGAALDLFTTVGAAGAARDGGILFERFGLAQVTYLVDFMKTQGKPVILRTPTEILTIINVGGGATPFRGGILWDEVAV